MGSDAFVLLVLHAMLAISPGALHAAVTTGADILS